MFPRTRRLTAVLGGLTIACALAVPAFANASGVRSHGLAPDGVESHALAPTRADAARVEAYWKPDRLNRATDSTPKTADPKPSASGGSGSKTARLATAATAKAGAAAPWTVRPIRAKTGGTGALAPKTIGKVFFRIGAKEYWCSATSVRAKNRSLVATAAHCVFDVRTGRPVQDWIFVPNYRQGQQPDGIYVGHTLVVHNRFAWLGDYDYDYAFVAVHPGFKWQATRDARGQISYRRVDVGRLQDNVGGQGITVGRGPAVTAIAFGFPAGPQPGGSRPYNGHVLKSCLGVTRKVIAPTYQLDHGIAIKKCDFTAGASGGPWLVGFNRLKGVGLLNGINSLSWNRTADGKNDEISSPYFDRTTQAVYNRAQGIATG